MQHCFSAVYILEDVVLIYRWSKHASSLELLAPTELLVLNEKVDHFFSFLGGSSFLLSVVRFDVDKAHYFPG